MKTIIILMLTLICQFANGQYEEYLDYAKSQTRFAVLNTKIEQYLDTANFSVYDIPEVDGLSFTYKQYIEAKVLKLLLSEYDKYSKECYADSTSFHYYTSCYRQTGNLATGYSYVLVCENPDHFEYNHKIPTFVGFMEWLKTQINGN